MMAGINGRVIRVEGDDVSTDVIAPTFWVHRGRGEAKLETLAPHAFESLRPGMHDLVQPGDVLVVGRNFGAGSHREEAVRILQVWGVQAVIAESAARIYFRNAIAAGIPVIQLEGALGFLAEGDQAEVDFDGWSVHNTSTGERRAIRPFPPTILRILHAGGIVGVIGQQLAHGAGSGS